jgi:hypothetical protein
MKLPILILQAKGQVHSFLILTPMLYKSMQVFTMTLECTVRSVHSLLTSLLNKLGFLPSWLFDAASLLLIIVLKFFTLIGRVSNEIFAEELEKKIILYFSSTRENYIILYHYLDFPVFFIVTENFYHTFFDVAFMKSRH